MNEKIRKLWIRTIAGTMCRLPCEDCRKTLGDNFHGCPLEVDVSNDDIYNFIRKVTDLLFARLEREDELPFPVDLNEEDIINMIMEACRD